MSSIHVEAAINYCRTLTKSHSSTFYLGSRLFPQHKQDAVHVVYALCRSGDDAVDEAPNKTAAAEQLRQWWQGIERGYAGTPQSHAPLEVALAWALQQFDIPQSAFYELFLGLESDLRDDVDFATMSDLLLYCRRVAGVVGFLIAPIAGYDGGKETLEHALALGNAMQLTNILRDVGEDLQRGRCYLPTELLEKHGVCLEQLEQGKVTSNYISLLEELCTMTHDLYHQGWQGIPKLHGVASLAVGVAALNYEHILHKLRQNHYDNLNYRAYLQTYERFLLIPKAAYNIIIT